MSASSPPPALSASEVQPPSSIWVREAGVEVVLVPLDQIHDLIRGGAFNHALHIAALMLATVHRTLGLSLPRPPSAP